MGSPDSLSIHWPYNEKIVFAFLKYTTNWFSNFSKVKLVPVRTDDNASSLSQFSQVLELVYSFISLG
mgnify:CR=1 FL=1